MVWISWEAFCLWIHNAGLYLNCSLLKSAWNWKHHRRKYYACGPWTWYKNDLGDVRGVRPILSLRKQVGRRHLLNKRTRCFCVLQKILATSSLKELNPGRTLSETIKCEAWVWINLRMFYWGFMGLISNTPGPHSKLKTSWEVDMIHRQIENKLLALSLIKAELEQVALDLWPKGLNLRVSYLWVKWTKPLCLTWLSALQTVCHTAGQRTWAPCRPAGFQRDPKGPRHPCSVCRMRMSEEEWGERPQISF